MVGGGQNTGFVKARVPEPKPATLMPMTSLFIKHEETADYKYGEVLVTAKHEHNKRGEGCMRLVRILPLCVYYKGNQDIMDIP